MTSSDDRRATIKSFTPVQGFGTVELENGEELTFDASVARVAVADLRVGAAVMVRVGPGRFTGPLPVKALWLEGRSAPPVLDHQAPAVGVSEDNDIPVSPPVALMGLRGAGLLSGVDLPGFEALCREALAAK